MNNLISTLIMASIIFNIIDNIILWFIYKGIKKQGKDIKKRCKAYRTLYNKFKVYKLNNIGNGI